MSTSNGLLFYFYFCKYFSDLKCRKKDKITIFSRVGRLEREFFDVGGFKRI
jgi:hypothetical protein